MSSSFSSCLFVITALDTLMHMSLLRLLLLAPDRGVERRQRLHGHHRHFQWSYQPADGEPNDVAISSLPCNLRLHAVLWIFPTCCNNHRYRNRLIGWQGSVHSAAHTRSLSTTPCFLPKFAFLPTWLPPDYRHLLFQARHYFSCGGAQGRYVLVSRTGSFSLPLNTLEVYTVATGEALVLGPVRLGVLSLLGVLGWCHQCLRHGAWAVALHTLAVPTAPCRGLVESMIPHACASCTVFSLR